jgi:hypothetical protein
MPWANGLGSTLELAVSPAGASIESLDWRISIATVTAPGPFSSLPGIDRVLLVLDDVDAVLAVDGHAVALRRFTQVRFSGDSDVALESVSAAARDLNVMTRRGRWVCRMRRIDLAFGATASRAHATNAWVLVVTGTARATDGSASADLGELDLLRLDAGTRVTGSGDAVVIEVDEVVPPAG